ncbi:MAG: tetratricopeptide repeat protein [Chloroflexota bacterium]|nr:tetratricopeptide repeat protein [Chloroflexota bacterium]
MPKQNFYDFIDNVEKMLSRRQTKVALNALENAPRNFRFRPDFLYLQGTVNAMLGNMLASIKNLEEAVRRDRNYEPAYANLATAYMHMGFMGHAWRSAENYLRRDPDDEYDAREQTEEIAAIAEAEIVTAANIYGVSPTKMRQAAMPHERAQICLQNEDLRGVLKESKTAIRLLPQWTSPRNNRALALFMHGRIQEAISELEVVVKDVEPENVFALSSLVIYNVNIWEKEKAESYAAKLRSLILNRSSIDGHTNKVIEAFGWLEDDETLGRMASNLEIENILDDVSLYILGAGAANMGQFNIAKKILKKTSDEETRYTPIIKNGLAIIKKAHRTKQPLTDRLPTIQFMHYWGNKIYDAFNKAVNQETFTGLQEVVDKYPHIGYSFKLMLWQDKDDEVSVEAALSSLADLDLLQAYAEIERFATSKHSTPRLRSKALQILSEAGIIDSETPLRTWQDEKEEWAEVNFRQIEIVPYLELTCSLESQELMQKGTELSHSDEKDDLEKALGYYEQILELDPDYPVALHNKGMVLAKLERHEEARSLFFKAVEIDPDYLFGHLTLARLAFFEDDDAELCKDHITKILKAKQVVIDVYEGAMELQVHLAVKEREYEAAKTTIDMLLKLNPDSEDLYTDWLERIQTLESLSKVSDRFTERANNYHDLQFRKSITADESLESCIDRVSKDRLKATLESWGLIKKGRKAEVVTRIVEALTNPEQLRNMIENELSPEEREALIWVLEENGLRSWDSFTERFGDIYDESPHWEYRTPETIPGRLQMLGFLSIGTLDDQRVTLIPSELRPLLDNIL